MRQWFFDRINLALDKAIMDTPTEWLERKPHQMHVTLSDSANKRLTESAKKYGYSSSTVIERAIDFYFAKRIRERFDNLKDFVNSLVDTNQKKGMELTRLLTYVLPFETTADTGKIRARTLVVDGKPAVDWEPHFRVQSNAKGRGEPKFNLPKKTLRQRRSKK